MSTLTDAEILNLARNYMAVPPELSRTLLKFARALLSKGAAPAEPVAQFRLLKGARSDGSDLYVQADIDDPSNVPLYAAPKATTEPRALTHIPPA